MKSAQKKNSVFEFWIWITLLAVWFLISGVYGLALAIFRFRNRRNSFLFTQFFLRGAQNLLRLEVEVQGRENIDENIASIVIGNHQSSLDMITLGEVYLANARVVGKKQLIWIPIFGPFFWLEGHVMIDRTKGKTALSQIIEAAHEFKKKGLSIWIFPEGTRNAAGDRILPFKRGAFEVAKTVGLPITRVVCSSLYPWVSWSEKRIVRGHKIYLRVLPPIEPKDFQSDEQLIELCHSSMTEAFKQLNDLPRA